jgi:hypothetical protein
MKRALGEGALQRDAARIDHDLRSELDEALGR